MPAYLFAGPGRYHYSELRDAEGRLVGDVEPYQAAQPAQEVDGEDLPAVPEQEASRRVFDGPAPDWMWNLADGEEPWAAPEPAPEDGAEAEAAEGGAQDSQAGEPAQAAEGQPAPPAVIPGA